MKSWPLPLIICAALSAGAAEQPASPAAPGSETPGESRPFLGVAVSDTDNFDNPSPMLVTRVIPGSTFDHLGVKADDRIVQVNGTPVESMQQFSTAVAGLKVDDDLTVAITRDGQEMNLSGKVEAPPRPRDVASRANEVQAAVDELKTAVDRAKSKSDLQDALRLVKELQAGLPAAAAEFKRIYPEGDFDIDIHIRVRSDKKDKAPEALEAAPDPEPKKEEPSQGK